MRSVWRWAVSSGLAGLVVTTAILALFSEAFYWYSGGVDYPARGLPIAATAASATVDLLEPGTESIRRLSGAIVWTQTALGWLAFVAALLTACSRRGDRLAAGVAERQRVPGAGLPGEHP